MKQGENRLSVSYDGEWIYDIVLESSYGQLLDALAPVLKGRNEKNVKICIVTDSNVAKIHKNEVEEIDVYKRQGLRTDHHGVGLADGL